MAIRNTGTKNDEDMLHDLAYDIGVEHQWMNGKEWKDDTCKDRAYKLANLEAEKFKNGGKLPKAKMMEMKFIITGNHDYFKKQNHG